MRRLRSLATGLKPFLVAGTVLVCGLSSSWAAEDSNQLFADAKALLAEDKLDEAKARLTEYVKKYSRSVYAPEAQYLLGSVEEDFVSAVHGLRNTVRNYQGSPWARKAQMDLAFLYYMRENYVQAASEFRRFLGSFPDDERATEIQYWLGMSAFKMGSLLDAQRQLERAWETAKDTEWAGQTAVALCQVLRENRQYLEAVNVGESALNLEMTNAFSDRIRETLTDCYQKLGLNQSSSAVDEGGEEAAPPVVEPVPPSSDDLPFAIQVGAFTKKKWAQNVEKQLRSRGYDAYTVDGDLDGKAVHKVRVGRFGTQQEAERMAERIMLRENFKTYVVRD